MDFSHALAELKAGNAIRRPTWKSLQGSYSIKLVEKEIVKVSSAGSNSAWSSFAPADILATDWSIAA